MDVSTRLRIFSPMRRRVNVDASHQKTNGLLQIVCSIGVTAPPFSSKAIVCWFCFHFARSLSFSFSLRLVFRFRCVCSLSFSLRFGYRLRFVLGNHQEITGPPPVGAALAKILSAKTTLAKIWKIASAKMSSAKMSSGKSKHLFFYLCAMSD